MSRRMKTLVGVLVTPVVVFLADVLWMDGIDTLLPLRIVFAITVVVLLWLGIARWKRQDEAKGGK